ncbi:unnamed protein product [Chrysoparadoxa australica]
MSAALRLCVVQQQGIRCDEYHELPLECGVTVTPFGRYLPSSAVPCSEVMALEGSALSFLGLDWTGQLGDAMPVSPRGEPVVAPPVDHPSVSDVRLGSVSLRQCLDQFRTPETLDESNNWYCDVCKEHREAVKAMELWRLPNILVLALKRFEHHGNMFKYKLDTEVRFPTDGLDMSPHCHGNAVPGASNKDGIYDLFGVSNHIGGMGGGHYTAYTRDWDESGISSQWYCHDDNRCSPIPTSSVVSRSAYVLLYRRRHADYSLTV